MGELTKRDGYRPMTATPARLGMAQRARMASDMRRSREGASSIPQRAVEDASSGKHKDGHVRAMTDSGDPFLNEAKAAYQLKSTARVPTPELFDS